MFRGLIADAWRSALVSYGWPVRQATRMAAFLTGEDDPPNWSELTFDVVTGPMRWTCGHTGPGQ
jgi:hypothetical protein